MTITTLPNKVIVDGVPRYIAYTRRCEVQRHHFECNACGTHETCDKPYYTPDNSDQVLFLCDDCVRAESADPRFIWWSIWGRYHRDA